MVETGRRPSPADTKHRTLNEATTFRWWKRQGNRCHAHHAAALNEATIFRWWKRLRWCCVLRVTPTPLNEATIFRWWKHHRCDSIPVPPHSLNEATIFRWWKRHPQFWRLDCLPRPSMKPPSFDGGNQIQADQERVNQLHPQ